MKLPTLRATYLGAATVLLEIGPLRLLTDPVFDPAGSTYVSGPVTLRKTGAPLLSPESLPHIDAVLLSHDEHADNLDDAARAWLPRATRVLTTSEGAERLGGNATGLRPWDSITLEGGGARLHVTATPAQHGPDNTTHITGTVTGFLLEWNGAPGAVYISGDTLPHVGLEEIVARYRGRIEFAFLHLGIASLPIFPGQPVSMSAAQAVRFGAELQARRIVPIHFEGWAHFSEGRMAAAQVFDAAGWGDRVLWLEPGRPSDLIP